MKEYQKKMKDRAGKIAETKFFIILTMFASFYIIGEIIQKIISAPRLLRWHLSDFGFIPTSAYLLYLFTGKIKIFWGILISFTMVMLHENLPTLFLNTKFDLIDNIMFISSTILSLSLCCIINKKQPSEAFI